MAALYPGLVKQVAMTGPGLEAKLIPACHNYNKHTTVGCTIVGCLDNKNTLVMHFCEITWAMVIWQYNSVSVLCVLSLNLPILSAKVEQ